MIVSYIVKGGSEVRSPRIYLNIGAEKKSRLDILSVDRMIKGDLI